MRKIITLSLVASTTLLFSSTASDLKFMKTEIANLKSEVAELKEDKQKSKKKIAKISKKLNKVKAHDANDNIKWNVDLRTSVDSINYDLADGTSKSNDALLGMRLWLNMAYAVDTNNIFKARLSMNKAFGADFGLEDGRSHGLGEMFDWTGNASLSDSHLKVSEAYWLYLGEKVFGANIPWTFSVGRRPSTTGFLANIREDDPASSPLGHIINVEFDGFSSKLDLSNITNVPGMSFKVCMGRGSSSATPLFETATTYADDALENVDMTGFIFEPYNDGQYIIKTTWFKAFNMPGMDMNPDGTPTAFKQFGDIQGASISVLIDGLTEDGYLSEAKLFGSFAWTQTEPEAGKSMLGSFDEESGTSYWVGAEFPLTDNGKFGLEYNHGSEYWRPFTYAEDTMIGSKLAVRGDAMEAYFTYKLTDALSAQIRYTKIDYDYTGSNGFFGNYSGNSMKIDDIKSAVSAVNNMGGMENVMSAVENGDMSMAQATQLGMANEMAPNIVESAQDIRFYIRYRF